MMNSSLTGNAHSWQVGLE